ncbi:MAG: hypothetical protein AB7S80_16980, partial [Rhizobiaceae bacterium]
YVTWTAQEDGVYIEEEEGTSFVNLKMISQLILPFGWWTDTDISNYAGSLPEPAAVKLPQESGA